MTANHATVGDMLINVLYICYFENSGRGKQAFDVVFCTPAVVSYFAYVVFQFSLHTKRFGDIRDVSIASLDKEPSMTRHGFFVTTLYMISLCVYASALYVIPGSENSTILAAAVRELAVVFLEAAVPLITLFHLVQSSEQLYRWILPRSTKIVVF